jgi:hypothetical protein
LEEKKENAIKNHHQPAPDIRQQQLLPGSNIYLTNLYTKGTEHHHASG